MARIIKATTVVRDPATLDLVVLLEGSETPEWAVSLIGNPEVMGEGVTPAPAPEDSNEDSEGVEEDPETVEEDTEADKPEDSNEDSEGEVEGFGLPDSSWKVQEIRDWGDEHGVDFGTATKKEDLLEAIEEHLTADNN